MNTTELLTVFREEVFDQTPDYLWSDALVYTYIDDAQKQFCRETDGIEDARSFTLSIKADGTEWYAINARILKIRDAIDPATGNDVPLVAVEKMRANGMKFDLTLGPLKALVTGMQKGYVRAWPKPNVASTVELRTFRLPEDIAAGDDFEIDAQHVLPLLFWVKHKAYGKQDSEVYDKNAADRNLKDWKDYCAAAKREQSRLRRPVSTVAYGGC
jgi:hypothetical protein